ncbi:MAG: DUF1836 domain-containing protein [Lachnospiraceae bacterium]|nr:DUF1836 domain-containing protein [Lachnospiraceae bacterium]
MDFDKELVAGKLRRWEKYLEDFTLPSWNDIPDIGLYMEQVIILLREYLDYLPPELKDEQIITAATINNYVRTKIMPEPVKKKYYRQHIAYLVMICTMKQILPIAVISKIIPMDISEDEIRNIYDRYSDRHKKTIRYFLKQIRLVAGPILDHKEIVDECVTDTADLITMCTIYAGFSKLMAEKLLLLDGKDLSNGGSIEIRKR